jgi:transposase
VVVRLRYNEATRPYFAKRKADGKSKKEIFRCLKRYVAREVYRTLVDPRKEAARSAA